MNRRLDWEIRNVIETNTCVVNWEIHLRYTWCWVTMNRRLDWEIRNAGETNTSVVKVRNTLDKNLAKLGEDTLGAPATMLVNFFWVSQLILKIHAWAVPKMPHFGENSDIWLRYRPSKLKSHFLGTSFSRLTFFKVRRGPCLSQWPSLVGLDQGRYPAPNSRAAAAVKHGAPFGKQVRTVLGKPRMAHL